MPAAGRWADMRCLWVNFVRILKFMRKTAQKEVFFEKKLFVYIFDALIFAFRTFVLKMINEKLPFSQKIRFVSF